MVELNIAPSRGEVYSTLSIVRPLFEQHAYLSQAGDIVRWQLL
jgi:hypothetical protein